MSNSTIALLRRLLAFTLAIGVVGTGVELLLLEHFEDWKQYSPLILLALFLLTLLWHAATRSAGSVRAVRSVAWLSIVSGVVGVLLHYRGNSEFELEMTPTAAGWALFKEAMMGATPTLAPGAMIQLGLIALAWAFRHPLLGAPTRGDSPREIVT